FVHHSAYTAFYTLSLHDALPISYRIKLSLPLKEKVKTFYYAGTIASNPIESEQLKTAVFSCNSHYGFPNSEVVQHTTAHVPDMADRKSTRLNSSHVSISYAVFCL